MKRFAAVAAIALAAALAAPQAAAQYKDADVTDMQALRAAVKADKKALVTSLLQLTPDEAKKFWPIYDAYQRSLDAANRQRSLALEGLIGRDKPITDLYARNLARDLVAADEAELAARKTLRNKVLKALPPKKAARYLQLETKIRSVQAYDIAEAIPLIK